MEFLLDTDGSVYCGEACRLSEGASWYLHSLSHYGDIGPPNHALCIFCHTVFDSSNAARCLPLLQSLVIRGHLVEKQRVNQREQLDYDLYLERPKKEEDRYYHQRQLREVEPNLPEVVRYERGDFLPLALPIGLDEMQHRRRAGFHEPEDKPLRTGRKLKALYIRNLDVQFRPQAAIAYSFFSRTEERNSLRVDLLSLIIGTISKLQNQLVSLPSLHPVSPFTDNPHTANNNRYHLDNKEQASTRLTESDHGKQFPSRRRKSSSKSAGLGSDECLVPTTVFGIAIIALRMISYYFVSSKYGVFKMRLHNQ
jgi:hypothetical protein